MSVVEIVSPGNKSSRTALRQFVEKFAHLIGKGIHLLVVDLFPPTKRDPQGMYKAIWDEFVDEDFELPAGKPLSLASYDAGPPQTVYGEFIAVGDTLPEMPIFLRPGYYVPSLLEASYEGNLELLPLADEETPRDTHGSVRDSVIRCLSEEKAPPGQKALSPDMEFDNEMRTPGLITSYSEVHFLRWVTSRSMTLCRLSQSAGMLRNWWPSRLANIHSFRSGSYMT